MPVAEDLEAPTRERVLNPLTDGLGSSAIAHEHRLLSAARPALPFLNWLGMFAKPLMKVPGLGWITADPLTARAVLNDPDHFTLLSEGGVGHLWAQILGDWVYDLFDGAGPLRPAHARHASCSPSGPAPGSSTAPGARGWRRPGGSSRAAASSTWPTSAASWSGRWW